MGSRSALSHTVAWYRRRSPLVTDGETADLRQARGRKRGLGVDGVPGWLVEFFLWFPFVGAVAGFVALVVASGL